MFQRLVERIAACNLHAVEFEEMARTASDNETAARYFLLAKSWRHVAKNYEFVGALERFLQSASQGDWPPRGEELPKPPDDLDLFDAGENSDSPQTSTCPKLVPRGPVETWQDVLRYLVNLKWGEPK